MSGELVGVGGEGEDARGALARAPGEQSADEDDQATDHQDRSGQPQAAGGVHQSDRGERPDGKAVLPDRAKGHLCPRLGGLGHRLVRVVPAASRETDGLAARSARSAPPRCRRSLPRGGIGHVGDRHPNMLAGARRPLAVEVVFVLDPSSSLLLDERDDIRDGPGEALFVSRFWVPTGPLTP